MIYLDDFINPIVSLVYWIVLLLLSSIFLFLAYNLGSKKQLKIQKNYFLSLLPHALKSLIIVGLLCLYTFFAADSYQQAISSGIEYRDLFSPDVIRYLILHLMFIYLFSVGVSFKNHYLYLIVSRETNIRQWIQSVLLFGVILACCYWGVIAITLGFSIRTLQFMTVSVLSSVSLANLFCFIKMITHEDNVSFVSIAVVLMIYIFTFSITGDRSILFFNTSVVALARANLSAVIGLICQNIIVFICTIILLTKKGLE